MQAVQACIHIFTDSTATAKTRLNHVTVDRCTRRMQKGKASGPDDLLYTALVSTGGVYTFHISAVMLVAHACRGLAFVVQPKKLKVWQ